MQCLTERGSRKRDRVIGNPLARRTGADADAHALLGHGPGGAVDLGGRRRRQAGVSFGPDVHRHVESVTTDEATRGIEDRDDGSGIVESDRRQYLQRQHRARSGHDAGGAATLDAQVEAPITADSIRRRGDRFAGGQARR